MALGLCVLKLYQDNSTGDAIGTAHQTFDLLKSAFNLDATVLGESCPRGFW